MSFEWKGVMPALTTKFTTDDQLDLPLFEKNLEAQMDAGVDGIILGGTLGEASVLSLEEKFELVRFAVSKVAGKIPVILNIAEGSTREALKQASEAEKNGAKGLMMLPPMRYKSDHRETVTYFKTVAAATSLPIMIYNNPIDYKIEVTLDMFEELTASPNIGAVKESTRDVGNVTRMINRFGERFKILTGVDPLALESLVLGAHGWVAGLVCAFPKETVAIYRLVKAGRMEEAKKIYRWFMPLLDLDIHPKLVQYIKLAEAQAGIGSETVRAPRLTLVGKEREEVLATINNGIKTRPQLPDYLSIKV
jgi:4-hydroxy-tetrahydrodipicolinate synthase